MDPDNPVVKLCGEGMAVEGQDPAEAKRRFLQAWDLRTDDTDACIAAHYVARHQDTLEDTLAWNQVALDAASAAGTDDVFAFLPSLHLNLGKALEDLGRPTEARRQYELARDRVEVLPDDGYRQFVAGGIERALERTDTVA